MQIAAGFLALHRLVNTDGDSDQDGRPTLVDVSLHVVSLVSLSRIGCLIDRHQAIIA